MKRVLFYGDSNTWGYIQGGERFPEEVRFPKVACAQLAEVCALEEGLNGRNACFEHDLCEAGLLGGRDFAGILTRSLPVSALVLMLGTNDALPPLCRRASDIALDLARIVDCAREKVPALPILLLAPPSVSKAWLEEFELEFGMAKAVRPEPLQGELRALARAKDLDFIDVAELLPEFDARDGLHLSAESHLRLGRLVGQHLSDLLSLSLNKEA